MSYIVLAIPVFFLLIAIELLVTWIQEKDYYRRDDSLSDLACGVLDQLLEAFAKTALFAGYLSLYERARLLEISQGSLLAWVLCFLGVDFLYYWFHRKSHELGAFWAAHVVHHQSEEYNLTVALRQGAFQSWFSWIFYLPLALIGFPPLMFLAVSSFNTLYQFWIHTRTIGRLGPLELVFNTPSNHRVHHARNPKYIDRNHGGTLIVWDRLFGTYKQEQDEPVYGITAPLKSWNPLWANLSHWAALFHKARQAERLPDKLRLFLKPPGWLPEELGGFQKAPEVDRASYAKFTTPVSRPLALYLLAQFVLLLVATTLLLRLQDQLPRLQLLAWSAFVVFSLVTIGAPLRGPVLGEGERGAARGNPGRHRSPPLAWLTVSRRGSGLALHIPSTSFRPSSIRLITETVAVPAFSKSRRRSATVNWEMFATDLCLSPVSLGRQRTLPGAAAHSSVRVSGTSKTVLMLLWLKISD